MPERSIAEQFWSMVDRTGPCWQWTGSLDDAGYGSGGVPRACDRRWRAHQLAYLLAWGAVPPGLEVDHLCNEPACCRPSHLRAATHYDNSHARLVDNPTCRRGHLLDEANTYHRDRDTGPRRECRACLRGRARKVQERRRALGVTVEGPLNAPRCPGSGAPAEYHRGNHRAPCPVCGRRRFVSADGWLAEHTAFVDAIRSHEEAVQSGC